ncbi:hypothetical protein EYF80_062142 [Liparis tanakae]|uniref:Uncharacterized protein n=1 Tax=Liparis tanakae TaxID=230148 RepID=A0A4Z2EHB4_9TELE|nr:hypothetical protein EYF80_062142 [Liparis tanakae]
MAAGGDVLEVIQGGESLPSPPDIVWHPNRPTSLRRRPPAELEIAKDIERERAPSRRPDTAAVQRPDFNPFFLLAQFCSEDVSQSGMSFGLNWYCLRLAVVTSSERDFDGLETE